MQRQDDRDTRASGSATEAKGRARLRFDFVDTRGQQVPLAFRDPEDVLVAWTPEEVRPTMDAAERALSAGRYVAGFIGYEAAPGFDVALVTKAPGDIPLVWFGVFDAPAPAPSDETRPDSAETHAPLWSPDVSNAEYAAAFARVREAIASGDTYQTNYTFRLNTTLDVATLSSLYGELVAQQHVPYAALLDIGRWQIVSLSPELFFGVDGRTLRTRPMKGTALRGLFAEDDDRRRERLRRSPKDRAENVMIVDLARNDVGRIAEIGSVHVDALFDVERYPAVFQMTSTVTGRLRHDVTLGTIFAALFPAGSITGAPKTSSMRLIAGIETSPRGPYCGAIGWVAPNGDAMFNVAIRTAVVDRHTGQATYGVGGGITWDSTMDAEHAEAISKSGFLHLQPSFDLLETMRLESGVLVRGDRHLRRLETSANYFDFAFDRTRVTEAIAAHAAAYPDATRRLRVQLGRSGSVTVESAAFTPNRSGPETVALARTPVSSTDRFLFHKTTRRGMYDAHKRDHPGVFDVLLWNERQELTEFTIGNLAIEIDGVRWTPSRECGLLDGVFRDELLNSGRLQERVLGFSDLRRATRVWLINSLREWVDVTVHWDSESIEADGKDAGRD